MAGTKQKGRLSTTIGKELLAAFRSLAAQERRRLNHLLEEAIHDVLTKYREKSSARTDWSIQGVARRAHSRTEVSWPVEIVATDKTVKGTIKNVSKAGALIQCTELPVTSETFTLRIEIPGSRFTVSATVEKVRLNLDDRDSSLFSYDLAVRFVEINVRLRAALYNAITREARKQGRNPIG